MNIDEPAANAAGFVVSDFMTGVLWGLVFRRLLFLPDILLDRVHDQYVRRQPADLPKLCERQPLCRLMFQKSDMAFFQAAPEAVHRQMKRRIIILHGCQIPVHGDVRFQFFPDLADKCFFRRLRLLYLSAGKFPAVS